GAKKRNVIAACADADPGWRAPARFAIGSAASPLRIVRRVAMTGLLCRARTRRRVSKVSTSQVFTPVPRHVVPFMSGRWYTRVPEGTCQGQKATQLGG